MSIRGIDAQHMVIRTTDLVKETSVQQRKNELMHDYLTVQADTVQEKESSSVTKSIEGEQVWLHADDKEGGPGYNKKSRKRSTPKNEEDDQLDITKAVPTTDHLIDIKI